MASDGLARTKKKTAKKSIRKKAGKPVVGVIYASTTDEPVIKETWAVLERFGIPFETKMFSAHRQPETCAEYSKSARKRGLKVIIAGAGMAAHLPGVIASMTTLPVIGVPLSSTAFGGQDSLLSMVQMPAGVPVSTVAVGKAGAKNAALLTAQILALSDAGLSRKLDALKKKMEGGEKL